jgi:hypothetical protein
MTDPTDAELLARPGCMRATWWSRCRGCGRRINEGEIVILGDREGRRWWLCRTCGQEK